MARLNFGEQGEQKRRKRKGVHAKAGTSKQPRSKRYKKRYGGQGRV